MNTRRKSNFTPPKVPPPVAILSDVLVFTIISPVILCITKAFGGNSYPTFTLSVKYLYIPLLACKLRDSASGKKSKQKTTRS